MRHIHAKNHIEEALRRIGQPASWPEIKENWFAYHPRSYVKLCPTGGQIGCILDRDTRFETLGYIILSADGTRSQYTIWGLKEWSENDL